MFLSRFLSFSLSLSSFFVVVVFGAREAKINTERREETKTIRV